jgi:HlyD family secretion protein
MTRSTHIRIVSFAAVVTIGYFAAWSAATAVENKPAAKSDKPAAKSDKSAAKAPETSGKDDKSQAKKDDKSQAKKDESPQAKGDAAADAAPPTHTVKRAPMKVTLELDAVFEAKTAYEISVKPDEWNALTVENAVAHGAKVRKGDVLLTLETEKLDHAIADLRADLKISEISIRQSDDQLHALERLMPVDLQSSERDFRVAKEDEKYFADVEKPFALRAADFNLKIAQQALEYEQEELRQLEKMYKADDITEETEQIVLKRARDSVEKATFMVDYAKLNREQTIMFAVPRVDERVKEATQRKSVELEKNKIELPLAVEKQRLELEKLRVQRERSELRLKKLSADRELMTVKSPIDGIAYYGRCVRGRFSDSAGMTENLRRNGIIQPNQVVMTVVEPRPMFLRASVAEDELDHLRPGLAGVATPTSFSNLKLGATLDDVSDIPISPGSFDAKLSVTLSRKAKFLMPGMTCKVKLVPYQRKDAICIPSKAVMTDEMDDAKHYVHVQNKDGKPERRDVVLGEKTDKQWEIRKGLSEGDKVLLEAPKESK